MAYEKAQKAHRLETFMAAAREAGVKMTHQRVEIFREIASTDEHPDVDSIYQRVRKRIPTISPDTVYRTFGLLERAKVLTKVSLFSDKARYDANTEKHHHFVCIKCGKVQDFYSDDYNRVNVPDEISGWGKVETVYVELRGVCTDCRSV
jgi:Fur family peroxide stress response transcriptional regulator